MKKEKSIELLNKAIGDELAAVHQYISIFIFTVMTSDMIC